MKLHFSSDTAPGFTRIRHGAGFSYKQGSRTITDERTLERIRKLAIPPAWKDVWICREARGHLQATGRDARGRKQARYHADFRADRERSKYERLAEVGRLLPKLRRQVAKDLRTKGPTREKVLATVVRLLDDTLIRVGNDEYARKNKSFGLTTLRDRHVHVRSSGIHFEFAGKSGVRHAIDLRDRRLARIVKQCQDLPGQDLFQYVNGDGRRRRVRSTDVNAYLHAIGDLNAKDLRTWAGSTLALAALREQTPLETVSGRRRQINAAIDTVAARLGNTRAVCRTSYVHPQIVAGFEAGTLDVRAIRGVGLNADERRLLAFLTIKS